MEKIPGKKNKLHPSVIAGGVFVMAGLAVMPFLPVPAGGETPGWAAFLGRFHPVVLHLPIGVFLLVVAQELGAMLFRRKPPGCFPYAFGTAGAVAAAVAGFLLYRSGGDDYAGNETATRHLWGGVIFALSSVFAFLLKWRAGPEGNATWHRLALFGSVGIMTIASHDGGTLTHGEGFLTKNAPPFLKTILGGKDTPRVSSDPAVFNHVIVPILERNCVSCHKEGKAKGKLRLDTYDALMKGGADGPCVEPGKSSSSLLVGRMELPLDDEEHMPPKGKPQPKDAELRILKWWIDSGASSGGKLSESDIPEPIRADIAALSGDAGDAASPTPVRKENKAPSPELKTAVATLAGKFPGAVSFESAADDAVSFTASGLRGKLDDAGFAEFSPVFPHLVSADLSATLITDDSLAKLSSAKKLRVLRLGETAVTDSAIDVILGLPQLQSLNLYGTKVTDASVAKLAALPELRNLVPLADLRFVRRHRRAERKTPRCEIVTGEQ